MKRQIKTNNMFGGAGVEVCGGEWGETHAKQRSFFSI